MNVLCMMTYRSGIEFAVAVASGIIVLLLIGQVHVVLHHLVDLQTQLLVHFLSDYASVHEQGNEESSSHHQQGNQDILPQAASLIVGVDLVVVLYESYALLRRLYERIADHLEYFRSLEEAIEVAVVNCCLGVEVNA